MSSPTPPVVNPSPLAIGRTFLKQYYQVLTTTPDMIHKFYRPSSVLSHGEGSNPTAPATLEALTSSSGTTNLKDRFVSWADSSSDDPVRFELENGAIDAQESVNGGVLLVVTGHMYLGDARKQFCHTFFLNVFSAENSNRRQYYVHNDVLRFLQEEKTIKENDVTEVADSGEIAVTEETPIDSQAKVEEEVEEIAEEAVTKEVIEPQVERVVEDVAEPVVVSDLPEEFMEGVEETKDDIYVDVAEAPSDLAPAVAQEIIVKEREVPKTESTVKPKPPPGSWASLVASGGSNGVTHPVKAGPAKKHTQPAPKKEKPPVPEEQSAKKDKEVKKGPEPTAPKPADAKPRGRRDPDFTLVIKNVQDGVKEADVRLVFEPFAVQTNSKIVGITVSQRGLAFVDYDSAAPVLAALEKKDSFSLNGKSVNIDQKTNDNSSSKNRGRGGNTNPNRSNGQRSGRSSSNGQPSNNTTNANGGTRKEGGRKEGASTKSGSSGGGR